VHVPAGLRAVLFAALIRYRRTLALLLIPDENDTVSLSFKIGALTLDHSTRIPNRFEAVLFATHVRSLRFLLTLLIPCGEDALGKVVLVLSLFSLGATRVKPSEPADVLPTL